MTEIQQSTPTPEPTPHDLARFQSGSRKSLDDDRKISVVELFGPVIQGEGHVLGTQTMFIRFGGCDYRCNACDSLHAVLPEHVSKNSVHLTEMEIYKALRTRVGFKARTLRWVTFSGGNPCMWNLAKLVSLLITAKYKIAVETQGSIWQNWLERCQVVTVSPKGPGMGNPTATLDENLHTCDEFVERLGQKKGFNIKVVIFSNADLEYACMVMERYPNIAKDGRFYLSLGNPYPPTALGESSLGIVNFQDRLIDHYRIMIEEILADDRLRQAKITPQFHVLVYGNERKR